MESEPNREAGGDESGPALDAPAARTGPLAEPWLLIACLGVVTAAVCLVLGFYDAAFVAAALGVVAWFFNLRAKLPRPPEDEDEEVEDAAPPAEDEDSKN